MLFPTKWCGIFVIFYTEKGAINSLDFSNSVSSHFLTTLHIPLYGILLCADSSYKIYFRNYTPHGLIFAVNKTVLFLLSCCFPLLMLHNLPCFDLHYSVYVVFIIVTLCLLFNYTTFSYILQNLLI